MEGKFQKSPAIFSSPPIYHLPFTIFHSTVFSRRSGRSTWAVLAFLIGFAILIVGISDFYLIPALEVVKDANKIERAKLAAYSRLLLAIVLFILFVGLMLTFRIGRFFFPRSDEPRVRTKVVDAWAEAGRRAETKDQEPHG